MDVRAVTPATALLLGMGALSRQRTDPDLDEVCAPARVPREEWASAVLIEQLIESVSETGQLADALRAMKDALRGITRASTSAAYTVLRQEGLIKPCDEGGDPVWILTALGCDAFEKASRDLTCGEWRAVEAGSQRAHAIIVAWSKTFLASTERRSATRMSA